jgi:hypothetical protein
MEAVLAFIDDPVVTRSLGAMLSVLLLIGSWQKLRDMVVFAAAVDNYRLLPESLVAPVAWLVALSEASAAVLLLLNDTAAAGAWLAMALIAAVSAAVVINLLRGNTAIDCGCGGLSSQPLAWSLVARNVVLMGIALLAAQEGASRPLVWADYLTTVGVVLGLLGLYTIANQLMTNAPRVLAVRR